MGPDAAVNPKPSTSDGQIHEPSRTPACRRAVIDVGTNSVKLLVGDLAGPRVHPVIETSEQTRLGRGFYTTHRLQPAAMASTAQVVAGYAQEARAHGAQSILVVATSAVRDAVNQAELLTAIRQAAGLEVHIISGEQEATWAFLGITTDPRFAGEELFVLDVGGGSCQCIIGRNTECYYRHSFRLGSVRLFEAINPSDPPTPAERLRCEEWLVDFLRQRFLPAIQPVLDVHPAEGRLLVGAGGTCTLLATLQAGLEQFDRERIEAVRLRRAQLAQQYERLWRLTLEERRRLPGLSPKKADIVLTGIVIYLAVMRALHFDELRVSTRGLRFGALAADAGVSPGI